MDKIPPFAKLKEQQTDTRSNAFVAHLIFLKIPIYITRKLIGNLR